MQKRYLKDLDLLDDFLFYTMTNHPKYGEKLQQNATICDIEPEQKLLSKDIKVISRCVRYYHAIIDSDSLQSGVDYKNLKNVIVIMIMPFDPFGYDHIIYTIKNTCLEVPELPYEDGARTLFLYTKGTKGDCGEEQKELLRYMEHSVSENANSNAVKEIHDMVEHVKQDAEVSIGVYESL